MQLFKTSQGVRLEPDPLAGGLVTSSWSSAAYPLLDYWAWKYGYTLFYSPARLLWRTWLASEFPNGIASALYLVDPNGFLFRGPRDHSLCLVLSRPQAFVTSSVEIPAGQRDFLPTI